MLFLCADSVNLCLFQLQSELVDLRSIQLVSMHSAFNSLVIFSVGAEIGEFRHTVTISIWLYIRDNAVVLTY